jgi:glyoxylase-like metal-dependent hydrolase (beta-lactamase superfamily II)
MWDAGAVPDSAWSYHRAPGSYTVEYKDIKREVTLTKPLRTQLSELGYSPVNITYLALSHYHYDHTGNANAFSNATWLVSKPEYDAMYAAEVPRLPGLQHMLRLEKTKYNYFLQMSMMFLVMVKSYSNQLQDIHQGTWS